MIDLLLKQLFIIQVATGSVTNKIKLIILKTTQLKL